MSEEQLAELKTKTVAMFRLQRAPSQFKVFYNLLGTGRVMTVKELSSELDLTLKATERAVAKLLDKKLVQRSTFRDGSYSCDSKQVLLSLLMANIELFQDFEKRTK